MNQRFLVPDNDRNFIAKLQNNLQSLSNRQKGEFAWVCAARALPFLGIRRNLDYFAGQHTLAHYDDKQELLFSYFFSLDMVAARIHGIPTDFSLFDTDYANSAHYVASYCRNVVKELNFPETVYAAGFAFESVSDAVDATDRGAFSTRNIERSEFLDNAVMDAVCSAEAAYTAVYSRTKNKFQQQLFSDMDNVYSNGTDKLDSNTAIYDRIWEDFLSSLNAVGCNYWAGLYRDFFHNGLQFDKNKLKTRVNIPKDYCKKGAAVVGEWLKKKGHAV